MASGTPTGELAKELEVHIRTVQRWHRDGVIRPAWVTPGGHLRWDIADVRRQLAEYQQRDQDEDQDQAERHDQGEDESR